MARKVRWSELSDRPRAALVVVGAVEVVLTAIALSDLARRPAAEVRGAKAVWASVCLVQPIGPVTYLAWGRRRP